MRMKEKSPMEQRLEILKLEEQAGANVREICRRFGISPTSFYKWKERFEALGEEGLHNQSTRPHTSPRQTPAQVEERILDLRDGHRYYGARKLHAVLEQQSCEQLPCPSTVHAVLKRNGRIETSEQVIRAVGRFEHEAPNDLWQIDFKGHVPCGGGRVDPLTVLDDHSRFSLCLQACTDEKTETVQGALIGAFRLYGLPWRMTMDNGAPWGDAGSGAWTRFTVWLARLGVRPSHSRPYHPQTQGKDERFHRTLKTELLSRESFKDMAAMQAGFDRWRYQYNHERPHQALDQKPPISRYTLSPRRYPETLPPIDYAPDVFVRQVQKQGWFSYHNQNFKVSKAFEGYPIGLRPTLQDGVLEVLFCQTVFAELNLHTQSVTPQKRKKV